MRKLTVTGSGEIGFEDAPQPQAPTHGLLVKTAFSLISAGTESRGIVSRREDPREDADPYSPGYASAGVVEAVGPEVTGIAAGDRVAVYGGPYFYGGHVEYVAPTRHYAAEVPDTVSLEEAAFGAIGAITLHGFRRAQLQLGETVAVIGLGLLGQLIWQFARAAGVKVYGSDLIPERVELARKLGCSDAVCPPAESLRELVEERTDGVGVDAVIIAASARSAEPMTEAMELVRDKGHVVVVGGVRCEVARGGPFFQKEPDVLCSRAAGPGRYDPVYERDGIDYPLAYVRWTVGRNLRCFIDLVAAGAAQVRPLITHVFPFSDAPEAFDTLFSDKAHTLAVLLRYE